MANNIFRGPSGNCPRTVTRKVTGALKPGTFVNDSGSAFAVPATGGKSRLLLLSNMAFAGQAVETAYVTGKTGISYVTVPGDQFQALAVAATYTEGQALTVDATGKLKSAIAASVVVAYVDGSAGTLSSAGLIDVVIANAFTK